MRLLFLLLLICVVNSLFCETFNAPILSLTSNPSASNYYVLSWSRVPGASLYLLEEDTSSQFSHPKTVTQGFILSKTFENQKNGFYYYRVIALNERGESLCSNTVLSFVDVSESLPSPILEPIENGSGGRSYVLRWNPISNADEYLLEEATSQTFQTPHLIYRGRSPYYFLTNKAPGSYFYRVTAVSQTLKSPSSGYVNALVTENSCYISEIN